MTGVLETVLEVSPTGRPPAAEVWGRADWTPDGSAVAEQVVLRADVDDAGLLQQWELRSDRADLARFDALLGQSALSGFRRRMTALHREVAGSLVAHRLLDDLPILLQVSHQARLVNHPALAPQQRVVGPRLSLAPTAVRGTGQCEGWRSDGALVERIIDGGGELLMDLGAEVEPGPAEWSELPAPPPMATRRRRRVRLSTPPDGLGTTAAIFFRDSYSDPDGVERGLHSYQVTALIGVDGTVSEIGATGLILPWPECWGAAASAGRLAGLPVREVEDRARTTLVGLGTCTHLTDTLRTLTDLAGLADDRAADPAQGPISG